MSKKITLNDLAKTMKKGFDEVGTQIQKTDGKADTAIGLLKLTRYEMAMNKDMKEVKGTVNKIYKILDDETSFIQKMHAEYPIMLKRLERIETKLGIPHTLTEKS